MTRTVLFVDDEVPLLALVGDALVDEGFEVVCARSGVEAVNILEQGRRFDIIISDVSMPGGVSGVDLAQRARAMQIDSLVILASGHPKAQLEAFPADVEFVAKPYRLSQLLALIEKVESAGL